MAETQFGFKDLRTAAELALAPALPVSVKVGRVNLTAILPIPQTGKLGKVIGKIQKAAELAGDAYSTYKASIETLKELKAMAADIKQTLGELDAQAKKLLNGQLSIEDLSQQGSVMLQRGINTEGQDFFKASDLVQLSGFKPGPLSPSEIRAAKIRLDQRRKDLQDMYVTLTKKITEFINNIKGNHVKDNYYPTSDPVVGPTIPPRAQGPEAYNQTQEKKDRDANQVKNIHVGSAQPTFWGSVKLLAGAALSAKAVIDQYKRNPSYNTTLNMVFKDPGIGGSGDWSEPSLPDAGKPHETTVVHAGQDGSSIIACATRGKEVLDIYHRSGTSSTYHPNGDHVQKVTKNAYTLTFGDHHVSVDGTCHVAVANGVTIASMGDVHLELGGNLYVYSKGGNLEFRAENITLDASDTLTLNGNQTSIKYLGNLPPTGPQDVVVGFQNVGPAIDFTALAELDPTKFSALSGALKAANTATKAAESIGSE